MVENLGHIVYGKSIHDSGAPIEIFDPSNGEVISTISNASDKTIENTLNNSIEAFNEWKNFSIAKRSSILFEYKVLLEKNIQKLAKIISKDLGKVHDDAVGEVRRGIENVEYACGVGEILKGEFN